MSGRLGRIRSHLSGSGGRHYLPTPAAAALPDPAANPCSAEMIASFRADGCKFASNLPLLVNLLTGCVRFQSC